MAHDEPPHQDLRCLQIQLFLSVVLKELNVRLSEHERGEDSDQPTALLFSLISLCITKLQMPLEL